MARGATLGQPLGHGQRYIVAALVFFSIGSVLAMLIRAQLATPHSAFVGQQVYNQFSAARASLPRWSWPCRDGWREGADPYGRGG